MYTFAMQRCVTCKPTELIFEGQGKLYVKRL